VLPVLPLREGTPTGGTAPTCPGGRDPGRRGKGADIVFSFPVREILTTHLNLVRNTSQAQLVAFRWFFSLAPTGDTIPPRQGRNSVREHGSKTPKKGGRDFCPATHERAGTSHFFRPQARTAFGDDPKRFSPGVESRTVKMNTTINPANGTNRISIHEALLSVS